MTFQTLQTGQTKTVLKKLTTANVTEIYTGAANRPTYLKSLSICEVSGAATTLSLSITDGTTTAYIYNALSVAANATVLMTEHNPILRDGWSISAQAGDANKIDIIAVFADSTGQLQ